MKREWRWWLVSMFFLVVVALYVFWPRGYVLLPLAGPDDALLGVYRTMPCRDKLPSDSRAVIHFYDDNGVPLSDAVYTVTPVSVHKGAVSNYDVELRTGWYWVAAAKVSWCDALKQAVESNDYDFRSKINLNTLRFSKAKGCFKELCDLA